MEKENIYKSDDILIKAGKIVSILLIIITFGGQCIQFFRYSEKNAFEVHFKTNNGDTFERVETVGNSSIRKEIKANPFKFFKNKFPDLETATWKKNNDYHLEFKRAGKIQSQTIENVNRYIEEEDKIDYLKVKHPKASLVRKMDESKRTKIIQDYLIIFSVIFFLGSPIPISFLFVGFKIRAKENKILAIKAMLEKSLDTSIQDIEMSTGLTKQFVIDAIAVINLRGFGYFVIDTKTNRIMDARLRTEWIFVENCPSCGASVNQKVTLSGNLSPECQYCKNPFPGNFITDLKQKTIDNIYSQDQKKEQFIQPKVHSQTKEFNLKIFILLVITFWPIAIYYALTREKGRN